MFLTRLSALLLLLCPLPLMAQDATGTWPTEKTDQGHLEVQIAPCGAALCGVVTRVTSQEQQVRILPWAARWSGT